MLLTQFPDINMVRRLRNEPAKPADKWMNVVLNIKCSQVSRTGVESPYSIFLNKKGSSYCDVNRRHYRIETGSYLLTQPGEVYDLTIDNLQQTEICNIHINKDFFEGWIKTLTTSSAAQLEGTIEDSGNLPRLYSQLYRRDDRLNELVDHLTASQVNDRQFESLLGDIIEHLLLSNEGIKKKIASLPYVKQHVREDIYRRLAIAEDCIISGYDNEVDLNMLCRETAMSKFHFLRMFRSCYGLTPYQYLTKIRMEKAVGLLKQTNTPISEISSRLGFEFPNSFIKAFRKTYGCAPLQYRKR